MTDRGPALATPQQRRRSGWLVLGEALGAAVVPFATGILVRVVPGPASFEALITGERPRLVLLGAPPGGREEIERVASERARRPSLRAVLVNRGNESRARLEALRLGFDDALPADIDPMELVGRLRLLLEQGRLRPDRERLPISPGVELDLSAHELRRYGHLIHLRPKEYRLLQLLASHPGRAFTRKQLLDRVGPRPCG